MEKKYKYKYLDGQIDKYILGKGGSYLTLQFVERACMGWRDPGGGGAHKKSFMIQGWMGRAQV